MASTWKTWDDLLANLDKHCVSKFELLDYVRTDSKGKPLGAYVWELNNPQQLAGTWFAPSKQGQVVWADLD
eukprot:10726169-Karenia_brevis.AAC.2